MFCGSIRPHHVLIVAMLLIPLVVACGDDDGVRPRGSTDPSWRWLSGTLNDTRLAKVWTSPGGQTWVAAFDDGVLHFDGHEWSRASLPQGRVTTVWGVSDSDVWAAGYNYINHFDGRDWRHEDIGSGRTIDALWGRAHDDVYAAGWPDLVMHYDGNRWKTVYEQVDGNVHWLAAWGATHGDVYVAGSWYNNSIPWPQRGLIGRIRDGGFAVVYDEEAAFVRDMSGSGGDDIYAVGQFGSTGHVVHFDGNEWTGIPVDLDGGARAVWAGQSGQALVIGEKGEVARFEDGNWQTATVDFDVYDIDGPSIDDIVTCGDRGGIYTYDGDRFSPWFKNADQNYYGAFATSGLGLLVVGWAQGDGIVRRQRNAEWTEEVVAPGRALNDVWASSSDAYAVGDGGAAYHFDGSTWSEIPGNVDADLHAVWGFGDAGAIAVGAENYSHGVVVSITPGAVTEEMRFPYNALAGAWGDGPDDIHAVGGKKVFHFDGTTWSESAYFPAAEDHPIPAEFSGVSGTSSSNVFAVSSNGQAYHFDGTRWTQVANFHVSMSDVLALPTGEVFAVGTGGSIVHFNGTEWDVSETISHNSLRAVCADGPAVCAVGSRGTVLDRSR